MNIRITKEQLKNCEFPDVNIRNLTDEQARLLAKVIYCLIQESTINAIKEEQVS